MGLPERETACPECGGPLATERGETACQRCGLVQPALPAPAGLPAGPLGGRPAPRAIARRAPHGPRMPRGLREGRRGLHVLADALRLPEHVRADAERLHRRAHRAGATRGRRIEAVLAACLLDAARERGVPRTLHEVARAAGVPSSEVARTLRALTEALGARVLPASPARLLPAIATRADVTPLAVATAASILRQRNLTGRRPEPLAAAALLLACRMLDARCHVSKLADAAGVSRQAVYDAVSLLSSPMNPLGPEEG